MSESSRLRHWLPLLVLVSVASSSVFLRDRAAGQLSDTSRYESVYHVPDRALLPALSLGYRRAAADYLWLRSLVYFGDEVAHRSGVDHVFEYADAILELDPEFQAAYHWVGVAALYRPREVTVEEIEMAVAIQERGLAHFPRDGKLRWAIGATLLYELAPRLRAPSDREQLDTVRARGAELMLTAAALGAAPAYVALGSATMLEGLGSRARAIDRLEAIYPVVDDEEARRKIAERLVLLRGAQREAGIEADHQRLMSEHARDRPWLPVSFFGLTQPTSSARLFSAPGLLEAGEETMVTNGDSDAYE